MLNADHISSRTLCPITREGPDLQRHSMVTSVENETTPAPQSVEILPYYGVFDLFKIGIGPSSSHTVGPMRAAEAFLKELTIAGVLPQVTHLQTDLYGSLALTGHGHATDTAVLMGLQGEKPDQIDPDSIAQKLSLIRTTEQLDLAGDHRIRFVEERDLIFNRTIFLDAHPNGMRFQAFGGENSQTLLCASTYFSIGGGFVVHDGEPTPFAPQSAPQVPYFFTSAKQLLQFANENRCSFSDLAWANERVLRPDDEIHQGLQRIWTTMKACVERGCRSDGELPGGLHVTRRAPGLLKSLTSSSNKTALDPMHALDWVDMFAIAVNEENAAGGRVVTAPTNGAAGIIPAVLHYFERFCPAFSLEKVESFLLTAAVIGSLYKRNASISGAEVGCQGEVGVACSMAAGALTEVLGGTPEQVEQAAEIGMEHHLGLTCDPIKGLVQIPCIERNAMGAVKAINASRLALRSDGTHLVSLDRVIRVMKRTGADMSVRYKETSQAGLAVNLSEC